MAVAPPAARPVQPERVRANATAVAFGAGIAAIAAAQGAYFPTAWGWSALGFLWVAALALLLRSTVRLGRLEAVFLGLFAAFVGWVALSIAWSSDVAGSVAEVERTVVYAGGFLAFLLVARGASVTRLLAALLGGLALICAYALATRLFPASLAPGTDFAGYRLSEPLGYWNALGLVAAIAALLALGLATQARSLTGRCLAAATLPILLPTLLYTYSRGAWVALLAGLLVTFALARNRVQLATGLLVLAPATGAAVWLASRPAALTRRGATLATATHAGHRVAIEVALLAVAAAAAAYAFAIAERRVQVGPAVRRAYAGGLVGALVLALALGTVALGHPVRKVERAYHGFVTDSGSGSGDLNQRLLQFSSTGRRDLWRVALKEFDQHPVLGGGAGTFEEYWYRYRSIPDHVRDAHSLYLETLGELGIVGLVLLVATLAIPFAGAAARRQPLVPIALGAYAAFLVHAGYDWDWEMPAVTLAGVFCGLAALVAARRDDRILPLGSRARGALLAAVVALGGFALVGLVGNTAAAAAGRSIADAHWDRGAAQARRATAWAPWAAQPWYLLSQAELGQNRDAASLASLRRAIADDPNNYMLWRQLAFQAHGRVRTEAIRRAKALIPRFNDLPSR